MEAYQPPFTITNSILTYVGSIAEKLGKITAVKDLENKPHYSHDDSRAA